MHTIKFSKFTVILLVITSILLISAKDVSAQEAKLMPPVPIPQPNVVLATPQIRVMDAGLVSIGPSHAFEVSFETYFWQGLDKQGNPIKYIYPKGSEIIVQTPAEQFVRYSGELVAYLYIFLDYNQKAVVTSRVTINKANELQTFQFGLVQANQRILPGIYRIGIEIQINSQSPRNRDFLWIEENQLNLQNVIETKRMSPKLATSISNSTIIVINGHDQKTDEYKTMRAGGVNYYSTAMTKASQVDSIETIIDSLKKRLNDEIQKAKKNNTLEENIEIKHIAYAIKKREIELYEAKFFKKNLDEIKKKLAAAKEEREKFSKYLNDFDQELRAKSIEISKELKEMYLEMWWVGNLCLPKWSPSEKLGTLEELRKKWNIKRFLEGPLDTEEVRGKWKRDEWIKWMEEEWLPKFEALKTKFRLFFGDAKLPEDNLWHFGLNENMQMSFWKPKHEIEYLEMRRIFTENYVELYGKALANLLAYYHAEDRKEVDYPYYDEEYKKPVPGPLAANTYFERLKTARSNFVKTFAPKVDPSSRPDLSKLKKRKYYVSKNGLYIGPLEYDPKTGERNDGPYDESILNPKGQVGE